MGSSGLVVLCMSSVGTFLLSGETEAKRDSLCPEHEAKTVADNRAAAYHFYKGHTHPLRFSTVSCHPVRNGKNDTFLKEMFYGDALFVSNK